MEEPNSLRAWVLGGDARYGPAAMALRDSGLPVRTYGVPGLENQAENLEAALAGAELAVLPLRTFQGEDLVIGAERVPWALLPGMLARDAILIGGSFPAEAEDWLSSQGVRCRSVLDLESYQIRNAAVTAEGALQMAMAAMERTVQGADALVIGWGRIGKALAARLRDLGARVTVAARREGHLAEIETAGMRADRAGLYRHGFQYDLVCNTVPARIMDADQMKRLPARGVLMELASAPGGFPAGVRGVIPARGLPGKTAPVTAGEQLAEAVWECLTGEGRTLE